ncbi:hypothetical protein MMC22_001445 [Lobaria immixta]|nr:hypothetical protein [Lobaria immixta]
MAPPVGKKEEELRQRARLLGPDVGVTGHLAQDSRIWRWNGVSPVVAVLPTGGGKSLLFMLPAHCSTDSTTVVVVPLTALQHDLHEKCLRQGLSCAIWNGQPPPSFVQVVLVTPEAALGPMFGTFLNQLQGLHQRDRIVLDECHVVLNQQADFRPALQRLGELSRLAVQMVLLTATLPPSLEPLLWTRMFFDAGEVAMFRDRTTRVNIAYQVLSTQSQTEARAVLRSTVSSLFETLPSGKLLVYCNSRDETMELARELQCPAYHHLLDHDTRMAAQVQF